VLGLGVDVIVSRGTRDLKARRRIGDAMLDERGAGDEPDATELARRTAVRVNRGAHAMKDALRRGRWQIDRGILVRFEVRALLDGGELAMEIGCRSERGGERAKYRCAAASGLAIESCRRRFHVVSPCARSPGREAGAALSSGLRRAWWV